MKKILSFFITLCLVLGISVMAFAGEDIYVNDKAGLLTESEAMELNLKAGYVSENYGSGIYIFTLDDFTEYGYDDIFVFAEDHYLYNDLGMGADKEGVLLVLSMDERDYALIVYGDETSSVFTDQAFDIVIDGMLDEFSVDNWYDGFYDYIDGCSYILEAPVYEEHAYPVQYDTYEREKDSGEAIVSVIGIIGLPCLIAGCVCYAFKRQMRSVYTGKSASHYISKEGFVLTSKSDIFTHITQVRNRIKTNNNSFKGGGGTRVSSRGFSGRSGKF